MKEEAALGKRISINLGLRLDKRGLALVMVLWVLVLLSVIALEFSYAMRTEVAISINYKDEIKGYYLARAGMERAIVELLRAKVLKKQHVDLEQANVWKADKTPYEVSFHDSRFKVTIEDEGGKLNLNKASEDDLRSLLAGIGVLPNDADIIVDSIEDWRDEDDLHRLNGAENEYYQSLPEPYACKNADFDTIEELLLVRGVTPEFYRKLADKVTVYSAGNINVNSAPLEVLKSVIQDDVLVSSLVELRKKKAISSEELSMALEGHTTRMPLVASPSRFYTITSAGQANGGKMARSIRAIVHFEGSDVRFVSWKDRWLEVSGDRT